MTQATFDFGRLDWKFIKSGKNWGCWEDEAYTTTVREYPKWHNKWERETDKRE